MASVSSVFPLQKANLRVFLLGPKSRYKNYLGWLGLCGAREMNRKKQYLFI